MIDDVFEKQNKLNKKHLIVTERQKKAKLKHLVLLMVLIICYTDNRDSNTITFAELENYLGGKVTNVYRDIDEICKFLNDVEFTYYHSSSKKQISGIWYL